MRKRARAARAMVMVTRVAGKPAATQAMATTTRWWATKRAITRVAIAIATAMMMAGNVEGDGKWGNGNGNGNYDDG